MVERYRLLTTDPSGRTSVFGVWAVGNVTDPHAQVVTAAGQGSAAAIALNTDSLNEDVERAMEDYREGGVFSPETERHVSAAVLGDRRHGLA